MKGTTRFLSHKEIKIKLTNLLLQLAEDQYLREMDWDTLISRSAYYLAELNYIHPFREGNGRTIREFMRQLYVQVGYKIHWDAVSPEQLLMAMEESVYHTAMLESVLEVCLKKH